MIELAIGTMFQLSYQPKDEIPLYLWASYDTVDARILGQGLSEVDLFGAGLGISKEVVEGLSISLEVGYGYVEETQKPKIVHEVVYTQLVGEHNVYGRPVPIVSPRNYEADYEIKDAPIFTIAISYAIDEHWGVKGSYRYMQAEEKLRMWDQQVIDTTGGWWQGTYDRDLGGPEVTLTYRF